MKTPRQRPFKPVVFYVAYFLVNMGCMLCASFAVFNPALTVNGSVGIFLLSFFGDIGSLAFLFALSRLIFKSERARMNFLMILSIPILILTCGNAIYTTLFQTFASFFHLTSLKNPSQATFIWHYVQYYFSLMIVPQHFIYLLMFAALIIIRLLSRNGERRSDPVRVRWGLLAASLILIAVPVTVDAIDCIGTYNQYAENTTDGITRSGFANYYVKDFIQYITYKDPVASESDLKVINAYLKEAESETKTDDLSGETYSLTNDWTGKATGMNLIYVQLESTNDAVINLTVDGQEITPNLNKLAREGYYNDSFMTSSGMGNTSEAEFSALTGLQANGKTFTVFDYMGPNYPTLAKQFKEAGYYTLSLHGNIGTFYARGVNHVQTFGFDEHLDREWILENYPSAEQVNGWIDDSFILKNMTSIIQSETAKSGKSNFFCYTILASSHMPYIPAAGITDDLTFKDVSAYASRYLNYVHHVDSYIDDFMDTLSAAGLLDNTIVVFFGDHGNFMNKKDFSSMSGMTMSDTEFQREYMNVPLIMYCPTLFNDMQVSVTRGERDLPATMVNLFGLNAQYVFGTDILNGHSSWVYSPKTMNIIGDGYILSGMTGKVTYTSSGLSFTSEELKSRIERMKSSRRANDYILETGYFR